MNNFSPDD